MFLYACFRVSHTTFELKHTTLSAGSTFIQHSRKFSNCTVCPQTAYSIYGCVFSVFPGEIIPLASMNYIPLNILAFRV